MWKIGELWTWTFMDIIIRPLPEVEAATRYPEDAVVEQEYAKLWRRCRLTKKFN